jgi:hypothetical protein
LDNIRVLSAIENDSGEVLFLSRSIMGMEWPCVVLMFSEIVRGGQEIT